VRLSCTIVFAGSHVTAGAAAELPDAVLTNPWWIDGMATDMLRALRMSKEERVEIHERLLRSLHRHTASSWAGSFLSALDPVFAA
jgi:trehalose-6-phosphate synthase